MYSLIRLSVLASITALSLVGCDGGTASMDDASIDAGDSALPPLDAPMPDAGEDSGRPALTLSGDDEIIVGSSWLEMHLADADVQVIDVRSEGDYLAARIPGALRVDVGELRATIDGVPAQVVGISEAEAVFRAAGVREDAALVVYGPEITTPPARLVWTFEYFGHERVALLDGGFSSWDDGSRATESGAAMITPSAYAITGIDAERRVDANFIVARLDDPAMSLVDARSDAEFASGRLPGALSVNWTRNLSRGALLGDAELRALYGTLDPAVTTVTYCQTGSRASVAYVVLRSLGFADVRLYDGSWAEWGSRPELPREP